MADTFLPEDYQLPSAANDYMKLQPGSNRFRIMGSFKAEPPTAVMGWLAWKREADKNSPVRFRMADKPPVGSFDEEPKHFWAIGVINVNHKMFQVLELTQKSILDELDKMFKDADWGDPKGYDIDIFRVGENKETKYQTNPKPHSDLSDELLSLVRPLNLNRLFDGEDPFELELTDKEPGPAEPDF